MTVPGGDPAVATAIAERAGDRFRCGRPDRTRTGSADIPVRQDCASRLAGVVEGGFATLHTVDAADATFLHELLSRYAAHTGVPVLRSTPLPADPWGALAGVRSTSSSSGTCWWSGRPRSAAPSEEHLRVEV